MKNGEIAYLAFTEKGRALAETLRAVLGGEVSCTRDGVSLQDWTARAFASCRALVFIGAAGIAVRAIAPYLHGKASDPAVVAVDECGYFAVSLLSGHLGGANALTREIARICGAEAVITTETDRRPGPDQGGLRKAAGGKAHPGPLRLPHRRRAAGGGGAS